MSTKRCQSVILTHKTGATYHWQLPVIMTLDDGSELLVTGTLDSDTFAGKMKDGKGARSRYNPKNAHWDVHGLFSKVEPVTSMADDVARRILRMEARMADDAELGLG